MKLNELIALSDKCGEYDITVKKSDRGQLSCHTTMPIESFSMGFDWTANQLILNPVNELFSASIPPDEKVIGRLKFYSEERTKTLSHLATLSRLIQEVKDDDLRQKMRKEIMEIL